MRETTSDIARHALIWLLVGLGALASLLGIGWAALAAVRLLFALFGGPR